MKRVLAILLALVLCLGVFVGCQPSNSGNTGDNGGNTGNEGGDDVQVELNNDGPRFDTLTKIVMYMPQNNIYDLEGTYLDNLLKSQENIDLEIHVDEGGVITQMLIEKKVPDLQFATGLGAAAAYGPSGAYINILDYLNKMPNLKAWLEKYPEYKDAHIASDGKMYAVPCIDEQSTNPWAFFYRKDIFDKLNLTFATDADSFYNMLKTLKEAYPKSYPFALRQMTGNMHALRYLSTMFGGSMPDYVNTHACMEYDSAKNEWFFGFTSQGMKECLQFLKKLMDDGLMNPSSLTMGTNAWTGVFTAGDNQANAAFVGFDKMDRLPAVLNPTGRALNSEFNMVAGAPMKLGENGVAATLADPYSTYNLIIGNNANVENTVRYVDWLFSDEGIMTTNWGKEGETYTLDAEGKPQWIESVKNESDPQGKRGLGVGSMYGVKDFEAYAALQTEEHMASLALASQYAVHPNTPTLTYNSIEEQVANTYAVSLIEFARAEVQKFLKGDRSFSEWDMFATESQASIRGYSQLMTIHQDAYNRFLASKG